MDSLYRCRSCGHEGGPPHSKRSIRSQGSSPCTRLIAARSEWIMSSSVLDGRLIAHSHNRPLQVDRHTAGPSSMYKLSKQLTSVVVQKRRNRLTRTPSERLVVFIVLPKASIMGRRRQIGYALHVRETFDRCHPAVSDVTGSAMVVLYCTTATS